MPPAGWFKNPPPEHWQNKQRKLGLSDAQIREKWSVSITAKQRKGVIFNETMKRRKLALAEQRVANGNADNHTKTMVAKGG